MYRVGILGTENSHAMAFAEEINLPGADGKVKYPDFKVVALYASERQPSEEIVEKCGKDIVIYDKPEDMLGKIDCAMITSRHGKFHKELAMPFIKAGLPCFIDKPFTISIEDMNEVVAEAAKSGSPLSGGSGCKYIPELFEMRDVIKAGELGKLRSGVITFPAEMDSEYGGFYFYASHLIEMTITAFGKDIKSILACENGGNLIAIARYDGFDVVMDFVQNGYYTATAYFERGNCVKTPCLDTIYAAELEQFINMVRSGKSSLDIGELTQPVYILNAIEKSLNEKREVALSEF